MSLSVRKGFIWPTADIYGGFGGFYDYGRSVTQDLRNAVR